MKDGGVYTIRPIHPDDADMLQALARGLSPESRYFRFASTLPELPLRLQARFALIDYDREMALVAVVTDTRTEAQAPNLTSERIVGVSPSVTNPDGSPCEFAPPMADDFSGRGLGTRRLLSIVEAARRMGLAEVMGLVLTINAAMLKPVKGLAFQVAANPDDPDFRIATLAL